MPAARVDAHLATCPDCRSWALAAGSLSRTLGVAPVDHVGVPAGVLATLLRDAGRARRSPAGVLHLRVALALVAVVQLVVAWPGLLLDERHAAGHVAHELTSWDLGLAVGFLVLAWRPSRAWGALPLVAVLVACLAGVSLVDVVSGAALLGRELVHLLEVAGLVCLWVLARRVPRSSIVLRMA